VNTHTFTLTTKAGILAVLIGGTRGGCNDNNDAYRKYDRYDIQEYPNRTFGFYLINNVTLYKIFYFQTNYFIAVRIIFKQFGILQ